MDGIQVLLAKDRALARRGIREQVDCEHDLEVVAEAGNGEEAVRLAEVYHPDVILMDVAMPQQNGVEATRQIRATHPEIAVLLLTAYDDDEYMSAFLEAGATGYVLDGAAPEDVVKAIRAVYWSRRRAPCMWAGQCLIRRPPAR
jgi:DNA-binding NarL/FixJ family response regulator